MSPPGDPLVSTKKFQLIRFSRWPAIGNTYMNVFIYYIDYYYELKTESSLPIQEFYNRYYTNQ